MPQGDKSKYTAKQDRKADHIAEGYEKKGVSKPEAESRAWATVTSRTAAARRKAARAANPPTIRPSQKIHPQTRPARLPPSAGRAHMWAAI
jgi:hypothetical protein